MDSITYYWLSRTVDKYTVSYSVECVNVSWESPYHCYSHGKYIFLSYSANERKLMQNITSRWQRTAPCFIYIIEWIHFIFVMSFRHLLCGSVCVMKCHNYHIDNDWQVSVLLYFVSFELCWHLIILSSCSSLISCCLDYCIVLGITCKYFHEIISWYILVIEETTTGWASMWLRILWFFKNQLMDISYS